jgi:hypothetical protein
MTLAIACFACLAIGGVLGFLLGRAVVAAVVGAPVGEGAPPASRKLPAGLLAAAMAAGYGTHTAQVEVAQANALSEAQAAAADCWDCELDKIRGSVVCAPAPRCMDGEAAPVSPCGGADGGPCVEATWVCDRNDAGADVCRVE